MKIICVDDEKVVLNHTVRLCEELEQKPQVLSFCKVNEALKRFEKGDCDIALLDIDIPDNVLAIGSPCRVVRDIGERDKEFFFRDERIDWDNVGQYANRE